MWAHASKFSFYAARIPFALRVLWENKMKAPGFFKKHFLLNSLFLLPVVFLGKKSKYAIKSLFLHHISSNKLQIQIAHYIKLSKTIQFNASSTPYLQLFIFSKTIKLYLHTNFSCFQCWKVSQSIYYYII